ncbi:NAD(P)H dehydrogenase (quinone) [Rhizobium albus]|jgi:NAD(P)H dehydrogenase (quinone)|nr:NAD(P)H dehydrogenase (quinone) [Rhizobium albus]
MRVHVVHAHPVETSFNRTLFNTVCETLQGAGHEVDPLSLYDEGFEAALSREERLNYHEVPGNVTDTIRPYVERLNAADAMVFVHPVWNFGYPAILKGYFDRIFVPGVSFTMSAGADRGRLVPNLTHIQKVVFVATYGGDRWRAMLMGDPPRKMARRWAWATFRGKRPPDYLALYDMNNNEAPELNGFIERVRKHFERF